MIILGISAFFHDSAACLIRDGEIVSAVQEERFNRVKHYEGFPESSVEFCLKSEGLSFSNIDYVVFYEKPFLRFERLLETYLAFAPRGFKSFRKSMPLWIKEKVFQKTLLIKALKKLDASVNWKEKLLFSDHHLSHAASAFFPSPFKEAAVLTMDGVGEWATSAISYGSENKIEIKKEINFPHSLGLLYSAFTYYTGFKVNSGEYKVMGLAPYGDPIYVEKIKDNLIEILDDGSFKLDMSFFDYCTGLTMTNKKFHNLFGQKPRAPEATLTQFHMDIAASIQKVTEEVVLKMCKNIASTMKTKNLCLAGGVALNCVANGIIEKQGIFENIWIQPASGDAGGALGAALSAYYGISKKPRKILKSDSMKGSYLGPDFTDDEIQEKLNFVGANFKKFSEKKLIDFTAESLSQGMAVGWMNGKMEFGPRALGARSILADPRSNKTQKKLNIKVKYRESFRPFAPSVLSEHSEEWFDCRSSSPYMLLVSNVAKSKQISMTKEELKLFGIEKLNVPRSTIPAVTHVDYSARIQTVHKEKNLKYHKLIKKFYDITGCPILVNTSFNVRGEPIVCSPEDAFKCFMGTDLDILVIGNFVLIKTDQTNKFVSYEEKYDLD